MWLVVQPSRLVTAPLGAIPRFRWVGVLAVLALCLASNMYFTKVFMPAHDITPGSKREILSIPFQQTASFRPKARRPSTRASTPRLRRTAPSWRLLATVR